MAKPRRTSSEHQQQEPQPREHSTRSRTAIGKESQILSILQTIRRPASPEELASRCESFDVNAKLVRRLCSIPSSAILLTENGLVEEVSPLATAVDVAETVPEPVSNVSPTTYCTKRKRGVSGDTAESKRRLFLPIDDGEANAGLVPLPEASNHDLLEGNSHNERDLVPLLHDSNVEGSTFRMTQLENWERASDVWFSILMHEESPRYADRPSLHHSLLKTETGSCTSKLCLPDLSLPPTNSNHDPQPCQEALADNGRLENETDYAVTFFLDGEKRRNMDDGMHDSPCKASPNELKMDAQILVEITEQEGLDDFGAEGEAENFVPSAKLTAYQESVTCCLDSKNSANITLGKDQYAKKAETEANRLLDECPSPQNLLAKPAGEPKSLSKNLPSQQVLVESQVLNEGVNLPKQENLCKSDQNFPSKEHDLKNNKTDSMPAKENMVNAISLSPKLERVQLPEFDNYIVEEEEGSGGYGTVYRARWKNDGKRFAIKCPHVKAHKHHVDNERKMLERFGGRNFIIKYEGSFRSGESECFVLKHVEQDRPEVLKKEIDLFELRWYGYCMFSALACLHKQDVVHRDVKPGNFLFSRKLNKGYLIDFNLAMDLQKKFTIGCKSKSSHLVSFGHAPLPQSKSALLNRGKKSVRADLVDPNLKEMIDSKQTYVSHKDVRKLAHAGPLRYRDMGGANIYKSQGVKVSGITSMEDARSARTQSTARAREPLPCVGRKELISLVQDAVRSPNHDAMKTPVSQRKRVAATPGMVDCKFIYTSPMSQHFTGVATSGGGLLKTKGDGREKREGPCVGTKGFRAPEVLFRSLHQGPKADVWSAGVTLLYLMIGRSPFTGDPEQNIKDIAKLKGSEDLWELSKLHDRESSFPEELLDIESLPSMDLKSWCKAHTKRSNFFKVIPRSLFDLVDKCLTVNPRLRISAEEALKHEFFSLCHDSLRKQRMSRHEMMSTPNDPVHVSVI